MCINQTVPEPGQKNMKFIFYLCRTKSAGVLSLTERGFAVTLWHRQPHRLIFVRPAIAVFWNALPAFGFPGSGGKVCPCPTTAAVTDAVWWPCLRTCCWHVLFWSRKLFLDATRLSHQPEFKFPTTGFSSFCFIASVLFLQNKRRSFWAHAETYSQHLSLLCWAQAQQKPCSMPICLWSLEKM